MSGRIKRKIRDLFAAVKAFRKEKNAFGHKIAILRFRKKMGLVNVKKYIDVISDFVRTDLTDFTKKFKNGVYETPHRKVDLDGYDPVWVCWLQGYESMPEICKRSVEQLKQHLEENQRLFFLTFENISEYLDIPEYILELNAKGTMTNVAFTDILRHALLSAYGGVWIDSVIWVTGNPFSYMRSLPFFSLKFADEKYTLRDASRGFWTNGLLCGDAGNPLFLYCYNAALYLWRKRDLIVDYLLFDYIIWNAYQSLPAVKTCIDNVPLNNLRIRDLNALFECPFSDTEYQKLISSQDVHLINRHLKYRTEINGALTYFGKLFG